MSETLRRPRTLFVAMATAVVLVFPAGLVESQQRAAAPHEDTRASYGKLPLAFEPNGGRFASDVAYVARAAGYTLLMHRDGTSLVAGRNVLRTRLIGARAQLLEPTRRLPGKLNLILGKDRAKWKTGLPTFGAVRAPNVYPGIDVLYRGSQRRLEYDFELAPGADPSLPAMALDGAKRIRLAANGDLLVTLADGSNVRQLRPVAYQPDGRHVDASFVVRGSRVSFRVGGYDRSKPLVIDPVAGYSTFVGGSDDDSMVAVSVGDDGSAYIAGDTYSTSFAGVTAKTYGTTGPGDFHIGCPCYDVAVTKLKPDGSAVDWATIIGGTHNDNAGGIALGKSIPGVYVSGSSGSNEFPITDGDVIHSGAFLGRLAPADGTLTWMTMVHRPLGGYGIPYAAPDATTHEAGGGIAVMPELNNAGSETGYDQIFFVGQVYNYGVCTTTCHPTCTTEPCKYQLYIFNQEAISSNAPQNTVTAGGMDGFAIGVEVTSETAAAPFFGTFLGGNNGDDLATAVTGMPGTNDMWVTGFTESTNFTTKDPGHGFLRLTAPGNANGDGFISEYRPWNGLPGEPAGSALRGAGYIGGSARDYPNAIAAQVHHINNAYYFNVGVVGSTTSTDWPQLSVIDQTVTPFVSDAGTAPGGGDGFYVDMNAEGSSDFLDGFAYVGGSGADTISGIAPNPGIGMGWQFAGTTKSTNFPLYNDHLDGTASTGGGSGNAFVAEPGGYSTLMDVQNAQDEARGITVTPDGVAYVVGSASSDLLTTTGAYQTVAPGGLDGFITRLALRPPVISAGPSGASKSTSAAFNYNKGPMTSIYGFECQLDGAGFGDCGLGGSGAKSYPGPLSDGQHTFQVRLIDPVRLASPPATRTFTVDTTPPTGVAPTSPKNSSVDTQQPTLTWSAGSDASTSVASYAVVVDGKDAGTVDASTCSGGQCSLKAPTALLNGAHTWGVRATDAVGNVGALSSADFTVAVPFVVKFAMAPNPVGVDKPVTVDASQTQSGTPIAKYEWDFDGDGNFETDAGTNPVTTTSYPATGTYNVGLRVTDTGGVSATTTQSLRVTAPTTTVDTSRFGVTINSAAQYTNDPHVKLTLAFPALTTSVLVSNDGGFGDPTSFIPTTTVNWVLDAAGPERLPKTVYVRYLPSIVASLTFTDDIILDTRPPTVSSASVSAASVAVVRAAKAKTWTLKLKAKDDNSGVGFAQATSNKKKPGPLLAYKSKLKIKGTKKPTFARVRDRAGNFSAWKKLR